MSVYGCPDCGRFLVPKDLRDDPMYANKGHAGCDQCGIRRCKECAANRKHACPCGGTLHDDKMFEAKGLFRLPKELRTMTYDQRKDWLARRFEEGHMSRLERKYLAHVIEELGQEAGSK